LYEALEGGRPSAVAVRRAPARIHRVLARALATDPAERYPSMTAMLAALRGNARRRTLLVVAPICAVLLALVVGGLVTRARGETADQKLCAGASRKLVGVWDADRKGAVRASFGATGLPYAKDTQERVERSLDAYTAAWSAMHKDACEATRVYGEQSE